MNYDIIIIGAGPAGISASLYAKRANLNVLVLYSGESQLEKAHKIDNYYGFPDGITGGDLYKNGIEQAKNLGVDVLKSEVTHIEMVSPPPQTQYSVKAGEKEYSSPVIILATGNKKLRPNIEGIIDYEGRGVSYCAVCDGFFYRKKNVAVIGDGKFAVEEAAHLSHIAERVTVLTDGKASDEVQSEIAKDSSLAGKIKIDTRKVVKILGNENGAKVGGVELSDGEKISYDGVFVALGLRVRARRLFRRRAQEAARRCARARQAGPVGLPLQGPGRNGRGRALRHDDESREAPHAAREALRRRRGGPDVHAAHGRRGGAAAQVHRGQRAQRPQSRLLTDPASLIRPA